MNEATTEVVRRRRTIEGRRRGMYVSIRGALYEALEKEGAEKGLAAASYAAEILGERMGMPA